MSSINSEANSDSSTTFDVVNTSTVGAGAREPLLDASSSAQRDSKANIDAQNVPKRNISDPSLGSSGGQRSPIYQPVKTQTSMEHKLPQQDNTQMREVTTAREFQSPQEGNRSRSNSSARDNNASKKEGDGDISEVSDKLKATSIDDSESDRSSAPAVPHVPFVLGPPIDMPVPTQLPLPQQYPLPHYQGNHFRAVRGDGMQGGRGGGPGGPGGYPMDQQQRYSRGGAGHNQMQEYPPQRGGRGHHFAQGLVQGQGGPGHHGQGQSQQQGRGVTSPQGQGRGGMAGRGGRTGRIGGDHYYSEDRNQYDGPGQGQYSYSQQQQQQQQQQSQGYYEQQHPHMQHPPQSNMGFVPQPMAYQNQDQYGRHGQQSYQQHGGGRGHASRGDHSSSAPPGGIGMGNQSPGPRAATASPGSSRGLMPGRSEASSSPGVDRSSGSSGSSGPASSSSDASENNSERSMPVGVAADAMEGSSIQHPQSRGQGQGQGQDFRQGPGYGQGQGQQYGGRQQQHVPPQYGSPHQQFYSPNGPPQYGQHPSHMLAGGPQGPPSGPGRHQQHPQHLPPVTGGPGPVPMSPHGQQQQGQHVMRGGYPNYSQGSPMVPLATGGLTPSSPLSGPISVPAPVPHGNIAPAMGMPVGMAPGNISIPPVMSGPGGVPAGGTPPSSGKFYGNQQMMMGGPPHYTPPYISGSPYAGAPPVPYSNPMPYSSAPLVSAPPKKRLEIRDKEGNVVELPQKTPKAVAIAPVAPMDTAAAVSPAEVVTAPTPAGEAAVVSPSLAPSASTPLELAVPAPAPASEPVTAPEVAVASVASAEVKQEVVEEEEEAWEKEDVNVIVASGQTATKNNAAAAAVVAGVSAPPGLELVGPASSSASALSAASAGIANILSSAPGVITITPSSGQKNKNKMLKSKLAEADSKGSHGDLLDYFSNSSDSSTPGLVTVSVTATATGLTDRTATPPMPAPIPTPAVNHTLPRAPVNFKSGNRTSPSVSGGSLSVSASTTPSIPTSPSPSLPPGIAGLPGAGDDESVTADNWEASAVSAATNLAAAGVAANVPSAAPPVAPVAPVVPVTPTPVPSRRELRPSGNGLNKIASSRGSPAIVPVKPLVKLSYSKDEMLTVFGVMSSQGLLDAPTAGIAEKYGFQIEVLYDTPAGGGRPLPSPSHGGGGMSRQNSMDHNRSSSSGGGGMSNQPSSSSGFNKSGYSGDSAWKRQDASVTAQQQSMQNVSTNQQGRQQGGRGGRRSAGPAPRKIITDPVEQLKRDVKAILNKITPQTFSKLSQQLCDINLSTAEMLDTLIHEIFEKAVDEPKFCQIYAETCHRIEEAQKSKLPAFIQIVHDRDSKTYASIRDLDMEGVNAAGPYRDESDCMAAAASVTPPVMVPLDCVSNNIELHKLIISNQILHKLFRNTDTEAFYVSFCPASEISHLLGEKAFMDPDNARADAVKMNTLKRKILMVCQQEYTNATTQEGYYLKFPLAEEKFREDVAAGIIVKGADNYEYETRESDLEMLRIKTKNRRMGNIRFVGELFKMKLVPARVMYDCISEILLTRDAEGEFTEWKAAPDDADIELLCHLLRTVGKMLDESNKSGCEGQMDNFFQRLLQLSTDKAISSRMRFALIELIELRLSKWVERREVEKPQTIEEIHAAAAAEEDFKAGGGSGKMTSNPNLRFTASGKQLQGGGDFRSQGKNVGGPGFSPGMKKNPNSTQNNRLGTQPRSIMKNPDSSSNQPPGTTTSSISSILDRYKNSSRKSGKSSGASGAANTNTGNSNNKDRNVNTIASSTPSPDVEQRQQDTSSSAAVTATGPVCFLDYDVEDLKGTVTSIIRDYLKEKDAAHAMSRIEEEANAHPPNIFGVQFILTFIEFSMDCKVSEQAFLLSWLTQPDTLLTKLFVQGEGDMAAALSQSDTIQFMPDSMSDFKNAPEWIGSILAHLVQVKALDLKAALAMSDKCLLNYLEDEFSDSATGNSCYARLKTAIAKQ